MDFREAYKLMKQGNKIKLPSWSGYWAWENNTIMMHCKPQDSDKGQGEIIDIRDTQRPEYTFNNIASDEWIIADENNCPILGGELTFGFDEAIKYIKRGIKVTRKNWENSYLRYVDPYNDISYKVIECLSIDGTLYPYIAIKTFDNKFIPWIATQEDILSEDWKFVD